jgi:hypothetical protein
MIGQGNQSLDDESSAMGNLGASVTAIGQGLA